jgi:ParB/RepB/Spo0J family partition protein
LLSLPFWLTEQSGSAVNSLTLRLLADSIKRLGLIHPIVVKRETNELVAGERRLEACRGLGWTHINCQFLDELDPLIAHAIELEENIKREALTWQDEAKAVAEYHALRTSQEIGMVSG